MNQGHSADDTKNRDLAGYPSFEPVETSRDDLDRLLAEFRELSDSQRAKGNYLEELVRHYLQLEPVWADQFENVWLWKDWPGRKGAKDTGADLIAETHDGRVVAVQVKFYDGSKKIAKGDLDSFLEFVGRQGIDEGIFIETSGREWTVEAQELIKNRTKPVRTISLDQLRHTAIDWSTYQLRKPAAAPATHDRKQLRDHQVKAVNAVLDAIAAGAPRGKLIMACGTGKTFTALKIAERVTEERAGHRSQILFMVPSLALLQQTLEEWSREHNPGIPFRAFAVGSDQQIGRKKTGDITSVRLDELGAPATTDGAKLAEYLTKDALDEGMTVVFATYHSIQAIHEAQRLGIGAFDLIICDEAHRTTGVTLSGEDDSHFVQIHNDEFVHGEHRIYMTATPRIFNDSVKNAASEKDAELVSMDDEERFGPVLYRIGFGEAVDQELLTDYKVLVLGVSEDSVITEMQQGLAQGSELQIPDVAKLVGCWNALAKRDSGDGSDFGSDIEPMIRAVAFAKDIKTSKGIAADFPDLVVNNLQDLLNEDDDDNLGVLVQHVDGTMGATERGEKLDWLKNAPGVDGDGFPEARVLTNARCLSEGVDVPSLDAVLFLSARKSQVDVVQAVGRVMRRAPGKKVGYIVLPVAIPSGLTPEEALNDNDAYAVVWQVLQALRSHDERLDAKINQMAISGKEPETIVVRTVDLKTKKRSDGLGIGGSGGVDWDPESEGLAPGASDDGPSHAALTLPGLQESKWKDAVFAKLVKKVGDRMYWDTWAKDIAEIAQRFIALINAHLQADDADTTAFDNFVAALRDSVNPEITREEAVELVAQHQITMPIFAALFPEGSFEKANPVSQALEAVVDSLSQNAQFEKAKEPLEEFYTRITARIRDLPDVRSRQKLLIQLYDKFFSQAFPALASRMGIVFTPVEVVDYILRSADEVLHATLGKRLTDEGVNIIDPFTGTGTFITRLLEIGLIKPDDLNRKFEHELFANEIVLLSYYIAAVNIESVYREVCAENDVEATAGDFPGICLVDTFSLYARNYELTDGLLSGNSERVDREQEAEINVIVMNPPYAVGQGERGSGSTGSRYTTLDTKIRNTYAARSSAQNKNGLYDSYYRALRWATERIGESGVIAFVSNSAFLDGSTSDGVRLSWQEEFSDIFVFDLRGNQRTQGEVSRREGGKVFGSGSRTGVAITLLVKAPGSGAIARVHYRDIGDYLTREDKLSELVNAVSIESGGFIEVTPNDSGDWINQRDERFATYQPVANAAGPEQAVFRTITNGLKTNRDAWCYNFSRAQVAANMRDLIGNVNRVIDGTNGFDPEDETKINWNRSLRKDVARKVRHRWREDSVRLAQYRPFVQEWVYFDRAMNDMIYRLPRVFPTPETANSVIQFNTDPRKEGAPYISALIPDLSLIGTTQGFPRYTWEPVETSDGGFNFDGLGDPNDVIVDGYRRVDNITDHTLDAYREVYGDESISKDDIFFYVYALLHHPKYRELYEADLKKMLPRIPRCAGFHEYARIGRELAELHLNYEAVEKADLTEKWSLVVPDDEFEKYRIQKLQWTKRAERTGIRVNEYLTLEGIPPEADEYKIGGRSPLEWIIDRYQVKQDKASKIVNDPNDWLREHNNPRYVVDLIGSLVTLSLETQRLIGELPSFEILDQH